MLTMHADHLRKISTSIFVAAGVNEEKAGQVSQIIVDNCLYGHDSHGMACVPRFVEDVETGKIHPDAKPTVVRNGPGAAIVDGHRGFGQLTMEHSMQLAIQIASQQAIGAVAVMNCNHIGMLWSYAKTAAENGMVSFIWCVCGPDGGGGVMAPYGGAKTAIGANPIAVGIPAGQCPPFVLDIATSVVSSGKVLWHGQQNKPIPEGWIIDQHGKPTTDPMELFGQGIRKIAGALLPMGGHKGFALGLASEIIGGVLTRYGTGNQSAFREGNGSMIITINVESFIPLSLFVDQVDQLLRYIKAIPTDQNTDEIFIPGELELRTYADREKNGIPVTEGLWGQLQEVAKKYSVGIGMSG